MSSERDTRHERFVVEIDYTVWPGTTREQVWDAIAEAMPGVVDDGEGREGACFEEMRFDGSAVAMTSDACIAAARKYGEAHGCREWLDFWLSLDPDGRLMTLDRSAVMAAILRGEVTPVEEGAE